MPNSIFFKAPSTNSHGTAITWFSRVILESAADTQRLTSASEQNASVGAPSFAFPLFLLSLPPYTYLLPSPSAFSVCFVSAVTISSSLVSGLQDK